MAVYTGKYNFTAGEISPLMLGRVDFDRYKNGCKRMRNMVALTQGPATRRSGFKFIYSLTDLGINPANPKVRLIPFIFNESQAYTLIFFAHSSGVIRCVFATNGGLIVYDDPPITECPSGTPVVRTPGDIVYLDMPSGWDIDGFDYAQSGDYLYIAQKTLKPHAIRRHNLFCWTVSELTLTGQPTAWSSVNGWPETVTFFQQRLLFGGTATNRQTVWTSRAGSFHDFSAAGSPLVDSDPITFTLDSETQNQIRWMQSVKKLNIGTLGNEWTVTGNAQTSITPTSGVLAETPTSQGSEKIKPLRIGLTTLFVEQHGRVVSEFVYDYNYDSHKTTDITILSPHLTEAYSIKRWTYQKTPDSIVWAVREDGVILGLTYQRQHGVVAWHWHDTNGAFLDVCSIPGLDREDDLWVVVKRVVDAHVVYYLEKKSVSFNSDDALDCKFLDSYMEYSGSPITTLTGLEHLEGETVSILSEGAVHRELVVSGGSITLDQSSTNVLVGFQYISEIIPTFPELNLNDGSSLTRMQKVIDVLLYLYRTLGLEIGVVYDDGEEDWRELPFRDPNDITNQALPLFNGVYEAGGVLGNDRIPDYVLRQRQPLPLTVLSVAKKVEVR